MGFFSLLIVASMPVLEFLLIGSLGAFLASGYINIFTASARRDMNKIVFTTFTPSLIFISLAKTVTFEELVSWWFMPFNIAITFLIGGWLGWIVVKIMRPPSYLEGLVVANCSAGNLGNLLLVIVPALCSEEGSPFASQSACGVRGASYVSLSMALGGIFIWTHTYNLMKRDCIEHERLKNERLPYSITDEKSSAGNFEDCVKSGEANNEEEAQLPPSTKSTNESSDQIVTEPLLSRGKLETSQPLYKKLMETVHLLAKELMEPPTIAAMSGFVLGAVPWLKSLLIGGSAPLRVIQDSLELLGGGTLPCTTLILGGNLIGGIKQSAVKNSVILAIVLVRYVALPVTGIAVVKGAGALGFLPQDPLFRFVLLTQFCLPSAVSIGVMAQLFGVGQEESSVIFLWVYLIAAFALTLWSTVFMYILS